MGDGVYASIQRILTELSREAIERQPLKTSFTNSKVAWYFESRHGYQCVALDEEVSYLETFNDPFGKFRLTAIFRIVY